MLVDLLNAILTPEEELEDQEDILADWFEYWRLGEIENFAISAAILVGEFFVVVGAGHFLVEHNIRDHLEAHNYEVKPFYK